MQERRLDQSLTHLKLGTPRVEHAKDEGENGDTSIGHDNNQRLAGISTYKPNPARDLAHRFQRLVNLDGATLEHLGRYERALSRQLAQTLFLLREEKRR